jgi:hypothetical protein
MDFVIKLLSRGRRDRINPSMMVSAATASRITPVVIAPRRLKPESADADATALVEPPAIFDGRGCVRPDDGCTGGSLGSALDGEELESTALAGIGGSKLLLTFVPIITSGGSLATGAGVGAGTGAAGGDWLVGG